MSFHNEQTSYLKTGLSDLQGAWALLRSEVVESLGFPNSDKILFHIDEAMSWECVRDLNRMMGTLLVIRNISVQSEVPDSIKSLIDDVYECLADLDLT
ncbi:hypothetical protein AB4428_02730 [Vibrio lentus]